MSRAGDRVLEVPKRDASGRQWPIWRRQLKVSLAARGLIGYLHGTKLMLIDPVQGQSPAWIPTTTEEKEAVREYKASRQKWVKEDALVKQQISVTLPDSLFIDIMSKDTSHECFEVLQNKFKNWSFVVAVEKRCQLGELKLKDSRDARAHFNKIKVFHEELASLGQRVSDTNLFNIIFMSLPRSYNPILMSALLNMRLHNRSITAEELMSMVIDAYDQFVAQGTIKSKSDDVAFNADLRRDKGCTTKKFNGDCYNCGWHGHRGRDCWEEGRKKHGQAPKGWRPRGKKNKDSKDSKPLRSVNVAADEKEPDAVWLVVSFTDEPEAMSSLPFATLAYTGTQTNTIELYDSGASQHLSPYHEHFVNFVDITPKPITATDKHTFDATGCSKLYVEIPNGNTKARILLKNVLYAPSMGVTLVSISKLAATGYAALFRDSVCRIFNPPKKLVSEIPISNGLYRV